MLTKQERDDVGRVLDYTDGLMRETWRGDHSEPIALAVLLCAGKVQELVAPDSAHWLAVRHIVSETDIGSIGALHRVRGVLRAATQIDGVV